MAAAQQRQRLPYLVTVARQSPLGFSRPATDSGRWMSQQGTSSSLERTGGSGGPLAEEVGGRHFQLQLPGCICDIAMAGAGPDFVSHQCSMNEQLLGTCTINQHSCVSCIPGVPGRAD